MRRIKTIVLGRDGGLMREVDLIPAAWFCDLGELLGTHQVEKQPRVKICAGS